MYLMNYNEPFDIFFPGREAEWDDMFYAGWVDMFMSSLKGLQFFNAEEKVWGQAHVLAAYVILRVVQEDCPGLVSFEWTEKEGKPYFYMTVDRTRLRSDAFKAISTFLGKLHTLKSIGDFESAKKFFDHYSEVDEEMLKVRQAVIDNRLPRRLELQPNLFLSETDVEYKDYSDDFEGIITSFHERFGGNL
mmetsp:Transcript_6652/g.10693  ORF Transcript_6652/g.10693 Transcript_6652/m.10693 type:complete len:190 (-) Transcript_6652:69-638(-)